MGYKVAVVGATGNVGREMLQTLAEREFPADEVIALASERSIGREVSFGEDKTLKVQDLAKFDFKGIDIVLSSPGAKVSAVHAPRAAEAGCRRHRQHLAFPHGPGRAAGRAGGERRRRSPATRKRGIIANPELLDHPDGGGAEAAARPRHDQARRRRDLPVGLRRRQGGDGRAVRARPAAST